MAEVFFSRNAKLARTLTDRELRSVLDAHESEASIKDLARRFTLTEPRIYQIWHDAGLPPRSSIPSITSNAQGKRARARDIAEGGRRGTCRDCGRDGLLVHRNGSRKGWICPDRAACREARGAGRETEAA